MCPAFIFIAASLGPLASPRASNAGPIAFQNKRMFRTPLFDQPSSLHVTAVLAGSRLLRRDRYLSFALPPAQFLGCRHVYREAGALLERDAIVLARVSDRDLFLGHVGTDE